MGTSKGLVAYTKHFKKELNSKGEVDTQIKPGNAQLEEKFDDETGVGTIWDATDPSKQIRGTLPEYTCVTFIDEPTIKDPKKVKIKLMHTHAPFKANTEYRIDIDRLVKPGAGAGAYSGRLKPQKVGLDERHYNYQQATDTIIKTINSKNTIPATMKTYLKALFWFTAGYRGHKTSDFPGGVPTSKLKIAKSKIPDDMWMKWKSTIQNDFGEVLGPFALYSYTLMDTASYNTIVIPKSCRVWWPKRPNERLLDFGIFLHAGDSKEKMMRFSSKAGDGATNTVKSEDITGLLKEKRNKKWDNKPQYKIFEALSKNSPTNGPILAVQYLMTQNRGMAGKYNWPGHKAAQAFAANTAAANSSQPYDNWSDWQAFVYNTTGKWGRDGNPLTNALKSKKIKSIDSLTKENIRYACETILRSQCIEGAAVSMNRIFADAIRGKVWYIKFKLGDDGIPTGLWENTGWKVERDNDYKTSGNVCFRTQNQLHSQKGKIGIEPKVSAPAVNA